MRRSVRDCPRIEEGGARDENARVSRVLVLHARLPEGPASPALEGLLARLPYGKRLELESRDEAGRHAGLAGLWIALEAAARVRGEVVSAGSLRFPQAGRPHLAGGPSFSITHGDTRVAAAVSDATLLGLDLEEFDPASCAERRRLERWTATEATLKAAGRGLRDAGSVALDEGLTAATLACDVYALVPVPLGPTVVASLASRARFDTLEVEEVCLPV